MNMSPKRCVLVDDESEIQTLAPEVDVVRRGRKVRRRKQIGRRRRRSRPETSLMRWKFDEVGNDAEDEVVGVESEIEKKRCGGDGGRRGVKKEEDVVVSARKLAAEIWKLQPDLASRSKARPVNREEQLGFQLGDGHEGMIDLLHGNRRNVKTPEVTHVGRSPRRNDYLCKNDSPIKMDSLDMEGVTKWDLVYSKTLEGVSMFDGYVKPREWQDSVVDVVSEMELKLQQAQARIEELEHEKKSSKKKLESFLRKISEEKAAWRSREHEKIRALMDDMKSDLNRERKHRQRAEIINSKLVNELAEAKLSVQRYMREYEKAKKARELVEEVCEELAKEIEGDKEDAEVIRNECLKIREEVDDERKMLQMAEVWREERVQMKLVDLKVAVEEKYSQMNLLVSALENFLKSRNADFDFKKIKEAEVLRQAAASLSIQDVRDLSYEPPKAEDIFAVFEDVNMAEMQEKDIEAVVYSPASNVSKIHAPSPQVGSPRRSNIQRQRKEFFSK